EGSLVLETHQPSIFRVFDAGAEVVGVVLDRRPEFVHFVYAGAGAKHEAAAERLLAGWVLVIHVRTEAQRRRRRIAHVDVRDTFEQAHVEWFVVRFQPGTQRAAGTSGLRG